MIGKEIDEKRTPETDEMFRSFSHWTSYPAHALDIPDIERFYPELKLVGDPPLPEALIDRAELEEKRKVWDSLLDSPPMRVNISSGTRCLRQEEVK